ncbi:MAG: IgGFc-binding protein [bacterium]
MSVRYAYGLSVLIAVSLTGACKGSGIGSTGNGNNNVNDNGNENTNGNNNAAVCGNDVVEVGEECDGSELSGESCAALGYSGGQLRCAVECTFNTDQCEIPPNCGNGLVDPSEECDGNNLGGQTCAGLGYSDGVLACLEQCRFDTSGCESAAVCGDGLAELPEECDGADLRGASCASLGHLGGDLSCTTSCSYDESGCENEVCGNGIAEGSEDCDGADLANTDCVDLGYLGGTLTCAASCSFDETGCAAEVCGNGIAEGTEDCDLGDLNNTDCFDLGYAGGILACDTSCSFDETGCVTEFCGNHVAEGSEECDLGDLNNTDCTDLGYAGGTLACDVSCHFNETGCLSQICGNGAVEGSEACDGANLNGATCQSLGFTNPTGSLACTAACSFELAGCGSSCTAAEIANTHYGCEFFAVDLPRYVGMSTNQYVISMLNPSSSQSAAVTIADANGVSIATYTVPAGGEQTYIDSTRTRAVPGAGVHPNALHITSTQPIAVSQWNELGTNVASTDNSLLLPVHGLARRYYVMDYDARVDDDAWVAVVGVTNNTTVTLFPTTAVTGQTTAVINAHDVMVITAAAIGTSLTGTRVEADQHVAVFGGNLCANVPTGNSYCDHIEEQLLPRQALGTEYLVGKSAPRTGCNLDDQLRVLADADNTMVTFDPPVAGPWFLNAGNWNETAIGEAVRITANHPIMVGSYLVGTGGWGNCNSEGDPAFMIHAPVAQYTDEFTVAFPSLFTDKYLSILAPAGAQVTVDSVAVSLAATMIGSTTWTVTQHPVTSGYHHIVSQQAISVTAYSYEGGASPAYLSHGSIAGLRLDAINPVE